MSAEVRNCQHKRAHHKHGTRTAYVLDKCRCRPCATAAATEQRARSRAQAYGRYDSGRVDAEPVRQHIRALMSNGVGLKRISKLAGVSNSTLGKILYGDRTRNMPPRARVERHVNDAVLAIRPGIETLADGALIDSIGTVRRVRALVAIGWSQSRIAGMAGVGTGNFWRLMNGDQCTVATARIIRNIYDQCWNSPQTGTDWHSKTSATRARTHARQHGWLPPLAWDDDLIDAPEATAELGEDTRLTPEERIEDILMFLESGCGLSETLARSGFRRLDSLEAFCGRHGRNDVSRSVRRIKERETA